MKAGKLNKRITIQQRTQTQDEMGGEVNAWVDVATVWASIEDIKGREFFAAQAAQSQVETRIRIRSMPSALESWRVLNGSTVYEIQYVIHESRAETHLMCRRA